MNVVSDAPQAKVEQQEPQKVEEELPKNDLWQPFLELCQGSTSEDERHKQELSKIEESYVNREKKLEETNLQLIHLMTRLDSVKSDVDAEKEIPIQSAERVEWMKKVQSCLESNNGKTLNCSRIVNDYLDVHKQKI